MTSPDSRLEALSRWVAHDVGLTVQRIEVASADASFRRYFRVFLPGDETRIVMDAPPSHENILPYLTVAGLLHEIGVHVPRIEAVDRLQGFVLLEDLGSTPYLVELRHPGRAKALYAAALETLAIIQIRGLPASETLASYDAAVLEREMRLMPEWFCERHLGFTPDASEQELLRSTFAWLTEECLAQPRVFVHRDYHSRNLMVLPNGGPGVIDFQDALAGPLGYDLVSLLKDCYIAWPRDAVETWVEDYRQLLRARGGGVLAGSKAQDFLRGFDLAGVQRHIKVLGIFARLFWRDGKRGYLDDLPLTLDYLRDTCARYPELQTFGTWLEHRIVPALPAANARARTPAGSTS